MVQHRLVDYPNFAPSWYGDAQREANRSDLESRRREYLFAVCCAESYLYEWTRDEPMRRKDEAGFPLVPDRDHRIAEIFADTRMGVTQAYQEIPKRLFEMGLIPSKPDFGGPHGEDWKLLVAFRDGLVHGHASRPTYEPPDAGTAGLPDQIPSIEDFIAYGRGWACAVVSERIRRLHAAAETSPPPWL